MAVDVSHTSDSDVPEYQSMLGAYHSAFEVELKGMIADLPVKGGDRGVELACGDGTFARWLAQRVGSKGEVVAVDLLPSYLEMASKKTAGVDWVRFVAAEIDRLPFEDPRFDLAWCAQSLYSLPDPAKAIGILAGLVRPGGVVAVLENDSLHHLMLPWPVELELEIQKAEFEALKKEHPDPEHFYVGRNLTSLFQGAGLVEVHSRSYSSDRQAPLGKPERAFLRAYLDDLAERVGPGLPRKHLDEFRALVDPSSPESFLKRTDLALTCLDLVVTGRRPA